MRAYNSDMRRVSRLDEVPAAERRELQRRADDLERVGRDLERRSRELTRRSEEAAAASDELNTWIAEFSRRQEAHAGAFPAQPTQAGRYDETVEWMGAEIMSVERRIRLFQFGSYEELVLTVAHEFGHALGLGHAPAAGALMSETLGGDVTVMLAAGLSEVDRRMLRNLCPGLMAPS